MKRKEPTPRPLVYETAEEEMARVFFEKTSVTNWKKYVRVVGHAVSAENRGRMHIQQEDLINYASNVSPFLVIEYLNTYECSSCNYYMKQDSTDWILLQYKDDDDDAPFIGLEKLNRMFLCPTCLLKVLSLVAQTSVNEALNACTSVRSAAKKQKIKEK